MSALYKDSQTGPLRLNESNERINRKRALNAGALGGKLLGAGGGGFLLLFCLPENMPSVKQALGDLRIFNVSLEPEGSKIVYSA